MSKFRVVLAEHGYATTQYEREVVLRAGGEFIDAADHTLEESLRLCEEADGILVRRILITPELVRRFRKCRIVLRYGVGVDNVNLAACTDAGIIVGHVPNYCPDEVSNHALGLLLDCVRHLTATHKNMECGQWDVNRADPVWRTAGRTLGIVGLGNIGRAVARKMSGWGMRLLGSDPFVDAEPLKSLGVEPVSLETLCRESDYVTLHTPLLPETHHLIGRRELAWMKPTAILVNTARGPVVDAAALLAALDAGRLNGAGLDVFEEEPLPEASAFRRHPRLVVTDHMAWYSEESQIELQTKAGEEVVRACTGGLPIAIANPEVLARLGREKDWQPSAQAQWQFRRAAMIKAGTWPIADPSAAATT